MNHSREKDTQTIPDLNYAMEKLVLLGMAVSERIGGANYFFVESRCIGCGTCERICLSQKIRVQDKKPVRQKNGLRYMCFACLNSCPTQAVQIKDIPGVDIGTAAVVLARGARNPAFLCVAHKGLLVLHVLCYVVHKDAHFLSVLFSVAT